MNKAFIVFVVINFAIAQAWTSFPKAMSSITKPAQAALRNVAIVGGAVGISLFSLLDPAFADAIPAVGECVTAFRFQ